MFKGGQIPDMIMILTEINGGKVHPVTYELIGKARELAEKSGMEIACATVCDNGVDFSEVFESGCGTVYCIEDSCFKIPQEELYTENFVPLIKKCKPAVILSGATNFGRSLSPRIAAALKTGLTADCTRLEIDDDGRLVQIRPAFSGNILAHIKSDKLPQMATIRYKEFAGADHKDPKKENIIKIEPYVKEYAKSRILELVKKADADITEAQVIVAAGRGVKRKEDLDMLKSLADLIGGQLGVTRALVDSGMADSSIQIGYSGHRVKPKLYIACGISGAPQHLMGMKESETVIAINSDASAPIFSFCNHGIVGDLYKVLPEMMESIKEAKGGAQI